MRFYVTINFVFHCSVLIAKPAPQDAPLKQVDYSGAAGPRYDDYGAIIPHSILGTVEEYKRQAQLDGTLPLVRECFARGRGGKNVRSMT